MVNAQAEKDTGKRLLSVVRMSECTALGTSRRWRRGYTTHLHLSCHVLNPNPNIKGLMIGYGVDDITNTDGRFTPGYCLLYLLIRGPLYFRNFRRRITDYSFQDFQLSD